MKLALLGGGAELTAVGESLLSAGHTLTHVGPVVDGGDAGDPAPALVRASGAVAVRDHHAVVEAGVATALLVSYGPLIDEASLARTRFLNIHNALLPRFRGFHGLVWSIVNGEAEVGFTLHEVDAGIDSGPIHFQRRLALGPTEYVHEVRDRILTALRTDVGAAVTRVEAGAVAVPQDLAQCTVVARRRPSDGEIDWRWPSARVFNLVRAVAPPLLPGAFTHWKGEPLVIRRATPLPNPPFIATEGRVVDFRGGSAWVMCGDRLLQVDEVAYRDVVCAPRDLFRTVGARLGR